MYDVVAVTNWLTKEETWKVFYITPYNQNYIADTCLKALVKVVQTKKVSKMYEKNHLYFSSIEAT